MGWSRLLVSTATILCLGAVSAACTSPLDIDDQPPHAAAPDGFPIGVSFGDRLAAADQDDVDTALDDVVRLGANWIRIDLSWARLQPTSSASFDWTGIDRVVEAARARDLQVLGILAYTPVWARAPGCESFACPPISLTDFADFATTVVEHLRPYGVTTYEVWNEPNLPKFWIAPDPVAYRNLLVRTNQAIKAEDPDATVLFGGMAPTGPLGGAINAGIFLQEACSTGACSLVDGVAYHPYTFPRTPDEETSGNSAWERMTQESPGQPSMEQVLQEAGLDATPLWLTEFGAPTGGNGLAADGSAARALDPAVDHVTEELQARIISEGVTATLADPGRFGALFLYTWQDLDEYGDSEDHFGLRRADGSRKPAWAALREAIGRR